MQIEEIVSHLYGKPCWGVSPGHGSFLTLEFGNPHLEIREPIVAGKGASRGTRKALARRRVHVHGEWHLWIYCCDWQVLSGNKSVGDGSNRRSMRRAAEFLDGQALTGFSISRDKLLCVFSFDLGATLMTSPYDSDSEQWLLYEPSKMVLVVRADGRYCYHRSDLPDQNTLWNPIEE